MKNKLLFIFTIFICLNSPVFAQTLRVEVKNTSEFVLNNYMVEIAVHDLNKKLDGKDTDSFLVRDAEGQEISSQVTYDKKLIFLVDQIAAKKAKEYTIEPSSLREYTPMVFGRHFPERYDDFAWENDKLGFRFYGKALKEIQAPTNGLDLWYKRTSRLVLEDWYRDNISGAASYHTDHGEGCDPYGVGPTLGGGAMAPYINDSLIRNINYEELEMLDKGPLRITAKLYYPTLTVKGQELEDTSIISLDGGSQYTKIVKNYGSAAEMDVAAGLVKRTKGDSIIVSKNNTHLIYVEPANERNGQIYLGLIFPSKFDKHTSNTYQLGKVTHYHNLALKKYKGIAISYFAGFGWNKSEFPTLQDFEKYTDHYIHFMNHPPQIIIK